MYIYLFYKYWDAIISINMFGHLCTYLPIKLIGIAYILVRNKEDMYLYPSWLMPCGSVQNVMYLTIYVAHSIAKMSSYS